MKCVRLDEDPRDIALLHLAEAANGWSVGTWGAIGEFQYDPDEPDLSIDLEALWLRPDVVRFTSGRSSKL